MPAKGPRSPAVPKPPSTTRSAASARQQLPAEPIREVVAGPETGALFRLEYCDVRFWYPWHFHPELEIKHIIRGAGTRVIGDSLEPFTDGDLCIIGSGTPHCWNSSPVRGRWVRAQVVQFAPELLSAERGQRGFARLNSLLALAQRGLQVLGPERTEAVAELTRLFEARTETRQLAHLFTFLAIIAEGDESRALTPSLTLKPETDARHQLAARVLSYIKEQFHSPLTEESTAREFNQSPSAFSRFFKREFGKSFSSYVVELRVGRASNLLLRESLEVREIAELAGFGTVASLNRHFRAVKMTTPTAYRRRGRELNAGLRVAEEAPARCDGTAARPKREAAPLTLARR